ncbi:hypothetical protein AtEden1_Chr1g0000821 [Arabidopsis thaliana]
MNPQIEKVVKVTSVVATAVVSYFLLTADYGPEPNALDPLLDHHRFESQIFATAYNHLVSIDIG